MVQPARQRFTFAEYLALEDGSKVRHEFLAGQVWAMAGGTPEHAAICVNVTTLLSTQLRQRPCRVFSSDLRVRVLATGLASYPDATVVCGQLETHPEDPAGTTVVNPRVLVEVLSPSTETYDRGEKLYHYKQIAAVEEIVLIAHEQREIEVLRKSGDGTWSRSLVKGDGVASLASIDCELPLAEVYRNPLGT